MDPVRSPTSLNPAEMANRQDDMDKIQPVFPPSKPSTDENQPVLRPPQTVSSQFPTLDDSDEADDGNEYDIEDSEEYVPPKSLLRKSLTSVVTSSSSNTSRSSGELKRRYTYRSRSKRSESESKRQKQWQMMLVLTDDEIRDKKCCSSLKCFQVVNLSKLRHSMTIIFSSSRKTRKEMIVQMYTSSGHFFFDGRKVCSTFLIQAFRFSGELQSSIRSSFRSLPEPAVEDGVPREGSNPSNALAVDDEDFGVHGSERDLIETDRSVKRDAIITFLNRTSSATANYMPDNNERYLPFVSKIAVYEQFRDEFKILYSSIDCPSANYFYSIWKKYCFEIKVRRSTRFSKCATCERIRTALIEASAKKLNTEAILEEHARHIDFISKERLEYKTKIELTKLHPLEYMSVVIDGADQSAYSLPHFTFDTKEQRGYRMKVHLIGLLHHMKKSCLELYTMTDEHKKGSNHIVELIHRFLNKQSKDRRIPPKLFIQMDNCSRENKNKFLMSYLDALVRWGIFNGIEASFLPVGHTHCDIDQAFSSTSNRLRTHNTVTLKDLQSELRHCYNDNTVVNDIKQVINWTGLCDQTNCCHEIDRIYNAYCISEAPYILYIVFGNQEQHRNFKEYRKFQDRKFEVLLYFLFA